MVTTDSESTTVQIFLPVARLAGHVAASAVGFIALGVIALVPVYLVKLLIWLGGRHNSWRCSLGLKRQYCMSILLCTA
jgi:hypothetical protein